jgi:hypothetical protein
VGHLGFCVLVLGLSVWVRPTVWPAGGLYKEAGRLGFGGLKNM